MSDALAVLSRIAQVIQGLKINPWLVVVTLGLFAAWIEQKLVRRKTPKFTSDHQGEAAQIRRRAPR